MSEDNRPMLRLTWSRQPHETGLARVGESPRGWDLKVSGETANVASVRPRIGMQRSIAGWYAYGSDDKRGVPSFNTCATGYVQTPVEAMAQAEAHILAHLDGNARVVIRRPRGMGKAETMEGAK